MSKVESTQFRRVSGPGSPEGKLLAEYHTTLDQHRVDEIKYIRLQQLWTKLESALDDYNSLGGLPGFYKFSMEHQLLQGRKTPGQTAATLNLRKVGEMEEEAEERLQPVFNRVIASFNQIAAEIPDFLTEADILTIKMSMDTENLKPIKDRVNNDYSERVLKPLEQKIKALKPQIKLN